MMIYVLIVDACPGPLSRKRFGRTISSMFDEFFFSFSLITDATYDYAVPMPVPSVSSDQDSVFSKSSSRGSAKVNARS